MITVTVSGGVGAGKSHVMATIEKALIEAYGGRITIDCTELKSERSLLGNDINKWQAPSTEKILLLEEVVRSIKKKSPDELAQPCGGLKL